MSARSAVATGSPFSGQRMRPGCLAPDVGAGAVDGVDDEDAGGRALGGVVGRFLGKPAVPRARGAEMVAEEGIDLVVGFGHGAVHALVPDLRVAAPVAERDPGGLFGGAEKKVEVTIRQA